MKNFSSQKLTPPHPIRFVLILIFTVGICTAQQKGKNWGFGGTFFVGHGHFTGTLKETYKGYVPLGMSFDVYYRNFDLAMGLSFGYGKTRKDIPYDTAVWKKKDWYELLHPFIGLGYVVADEDEFRLTPYVAFTYLNFSPATDFLFFEDDKDSPWDDVEFDKAYLLTFGINFDIKAGSENNETAACRLSYSYSFPIGNLNHGGTNGTMHTFTIGINARTIARWK